MRFFVGTYTKLGGPGLCACSLKGDTLTQLSCTDELQNPTYEILSPDKTRLYAVSSPPNGGRAAAFDVIGGNLRLLSVQVTGGDDPAHAVLSGDGRFLYTANYLGGSISVFPVSNNGLLPRIQLLQHTGEGLDKDRQSSPHVHQVTFIPGTNYLAAVDLGIDAVVVYKQDCDTGLLCEASRWQAQPGFGPRHLVYGREGMAYLAHELTNKISVLQWDGNNFLELQILSTLPENYLETNTTAAIRVSPDLSRLFVSNRGHDSLACYEIDANGLLRLLSIAPTGGECPRDFMPVDDHRVLIAHQGGDVSLCRWTPENTLTLIAKLPIAGAVCICL